MSFKFGQKSMKCLSECHPDLQKIAFELIKEMDVSVIVGHRGEKEQNEAFAKGLSKKKFPQSGHNKKPSLAMDICPSPINWKDHKAFLDMQKKIREIADRLEIKLKPLIKWDVDHVELKGA